MRRPTDKFVPMAVLMALALTLAATTPAHSEVVNRIAAVVNNEVITEHDLNKALAAKGQNRNAQAPDVNLRQEVLSKMIDDALFNQLLAKSKIEVTDDDLARAIANILYQNRMSIGQLKAEVAAKGMTYDKYKKQVEREIKRVKFINQVIGPQVRITDADLRDYYQQSQDQFRGTHRAHIAQIVIPLEGLNTQTEYDRAGDDAMDIVAKARHGTSFDSLAKQYSKGPNVATGGDMGMVDLKDLAPELANAVRQLKIGDVTNPIIVGNALVIVKLISLPELSAGDFEKLRDEIYEVLYDRRIEETLINYLAKERQRAFVEIR